MISAADFRSTFKVDFALPRAMPKHTLDSRRAAAMNPRLLEIVGRTRTDSSRMVSLDDFQLLESDASEDLCAAVAERSNVTPYCLDHKNRRMIFAETPPPVDLSAAPFYYQAQFETATRFIALPYERVHQIAMRLPAGFEELVLIYSVGRCGSTLVSKMWGRLDDTYSLSEPDVFTEISHLRGQGRLTDGDALQLLGSAVRLLYRPPTPRKRFVIKFRAQCIESAELMYWLHPAASLVFMYRNAIDCIDSRVRVFGAVPLPERAFRRAFPDSRPETYERLGRLGRPLLDWLSGAQRYLLLREGGLPFVALKYEELVQKPRDSIARLFAHCGVPEALVERACTAMAQDAQVGTRLARNVNGKRTLTADDSELIRAFFADHVGITQDEIFAGTVNCWNS
jgi:hypothetical protein